MPQSLAEAKDRLVLALQEQKELRHEIKALRHYIGLFQEKPDLDKRNKEVYSKFKGGKSISELAGQYGLSKDRIKIICEREKFKDKIILAE